ncbi:BolA/IbaG family iron-sulfur metabolism protein [Nocardia colli]|uniref:BolA/IbaG family iron-sulfur metabolism protein n=1 Tax=Nocardia colli TaxID=2545717 RepID=A0A5N0DP72_9NOCA|nr:BolA/IbaG family iron-sulfur metabolism protein [Nocardia colli]
MNVQLTPLCVGQGLPCNFALWGRHGALALSSPRQRQLFPVSWSRHRHLREPLGLVPDPSWSLLPIAKLPVRGGARRVDHTVPPTPRHQRLGRSGRGRAVVRPSEIESELQARLSLRNVWVTGSGYQFTVVAVGQVFAGMTAVQRQLAVQTALAEYIADGQVWGLEVHAYAPLERGTETH